MFRPDLYLFSSLVRAYKQETFSFSKHFSKSTTAQVRATKQQQLNELEHELAQVQDLLVHVKQSLPEEMHASLVDKVGLLREKIKEKKKKLDL